MRMIEDGLFDRFPVEAVYAVHNWPGLPFGTIAAQVGPMMAAVDNFELRFTGTGAHAAMPHLGDDPILAAGEFIGSVQRIVSRAVDPQTPLVVSLTQMHGGNVGNVVPGEVWLAGHLPLPRSDARPISASGASATSRDGIASAHGSRPSWTISGAIRLSINTAAPVAHAVAAAASAVGRDNVVTEFTPSLGCEDFAYMVRAAGGAYAWIGAGVAAAAHGLHGDRYDFNDAIVPIALRYWVNLARQTLPASAAQG